MSMELKIPNIVLVALSHGNEVEKSQLRKRNQSPGPRVLLRVAAWRPEIRAILKASDEAIQGQN